MRPSLPESVSASYAGLFGPRYRLAAEPWTGPDFSRVCWVFPGQGSGSPGMFAEEFRTEAVFRARLAEADQLAVARGLPPVSDYLFGRAVRDDALGMLRILALFTSSVAVAEHLLQRRRPPEMATAFSFGETTALTALGVVSFAAMFEFACIREECCPPADSLGRMIAVSGSTEAIAVALQGCEYHVSNLAAPNQTVITVGVEDVPAAQRALKRARLAARVLKDVHQPYHTPWLAEASARLAEHLRRKPLAVGALRVPFFSSVLRRLLPAGPISAEVVAGLLVQQLVEKVDFVYQVRAIRALGCCGFVEIGHGDICSRFVEAILPEAERRIWPLAGFFSHRSAAPKSAELLELTPARYRLLGGLSRAISKLTGYELASITVENRFQEDLGIDSIKKADILFTVVREAALPTGEDLNVSSIRTVADAVRFLEQQETRPDAASTPAVLAAEFFRTAWRWQPVDSRGGEPLPAVPCVTVLWSELVGGQPPVLPAGDCDLLIVHRGEAAAGDVLADLHAALRWLRDFVARDKRARLNVALLSCDDSPAELRALAAALKSLTKETPGLVCRWLQYDRWPGDEVARAAAQRELAQDGPVDLRFSVGQRLAGSLVRCVTPATRPSWHEPVVIAFGGARGVTRALLLELLPEWRGRLHVVGRTDASDSDMVSAIAELRASGAVVDYHALDAADVAAVERLFSQVHARDGRIDLVLNGAGIERSRRLEEKRDDELRHELAGKLAPALAIFAAARSWKPRRLIHFSSIAARYGNAGQTVYAAANQAMDELVGAFAREVPECRVTSIRWPAWDSVGMTAAPGIRLALLQSGVPLLGVASAVKLFRDELADESRSGETIDFFAPRDTWGFELGLRDLRALAPLLGVRHGPAGLQRTFDLRADAFLLDHQLEGRAYVPAALAVAMCLALARAAQLGATLREFTMHAPLVINGPTSLTLHGVANAAGGVRLLGSTTITHFSSVVEQEAELIAEREVSVPLPYERFETGSFYRPDAFFHGPTFQVLHEVWRNAEGVLAAEAETGRLRRVVGLAEWDRLVQAIDGCFQLVGLEAVERFAVKVLPTAIGYVRYDAVQPWPQRLRWITSDVRREGDSVVGDAVVATSEGRVLLETRGLRLRILLTDVASPVRKHRMS